MFACRVLADQFPQLTSQNSFDTGDDFTYPTKWFRARVSLRNLDGRENPITSLPVRNLTTSTWRVMQTNLDHIGDDNEVNGSH